LVSVGRFPDKAPRRFPPAECKYTHILSFSKIFLSRCCPLPGPADYKSMRPYIDITESAKKDAIKKMEEAFKKK